MPDADPNPSTAPDGTPVTVTRTPALPPPVPEAPVSRDDAVMSLVDHLGELRSRIARSIVAVLLGGVVGFILAPEIRRLLIEPLPTDQVQALGPGDAFAITLRISLVVGIILAMPVLLYQLWAFVSPGLTPAERRVIRPWAPLALLFFAVGVGIAWIVLPFAIQFLVGFTDAYITPDFAAGPYFDFVTTLFLAFGLLMEFPIVLFALSRVGIVTSAMLARSRRIAILVIAILAAVATPGGDIFSPFVLGGTMYGLFELTILAIRRSGR